MAFPTTHSAIMIFAQDKWKEKFKDDFGSQLLLRFWVESSHSGCKTCCTCEVCRGLVELFDPENASKYNNVCEICWHIDRYFKGILGKNDGFVRMAHYERVPNKLVESLFFDEHVKKVYVMDHEYHKQPKFLDYEEFEQGLERKRISKSDYLALAGLETNVVYEIIRDEYMN